MMSCFEHNQADKSDSLQEIFYLLKRVQVVELAPYLPLAGFFVRLVWFGDALRTGCQRAALQTRLIPFDTRHAVLGVSRGLCMSRRHRRVRCYQDVETFWWSGIELELSVDVVFPWTLMD